MNEQPVSISIEHIRLRGDLVVPAKARGMVLFAHGSGSSHKSPRNRYVASYLNRAGMATLLFDLLTIDEEKIDMATGGRLRFDIGLLSRRLLSATDWVLAEDATRHLSLGYFGASTGAAAALTAAAERPTLIRAIVSRGGRPDLAGESLGLVKAPTLLIVGGYDLPVIDLNRSAAEMLRVEKKIEIVPQAGHLFEEPGKLDEVAKLAAEWFRRHLNRQE